MALLRAKRRQEGMSGLSDTKLTATSSGRDVAYLQDLLAEFGEHTESSEVMAEVAVMAEGASGRSQL